MKIMIIRVAVLVFLISGLMLAPLAYVKGDGPICLPATDYFSVGHWVTFPDNTWEDTIGDNTTVAGEYIKDCLIESNGGFNGLDQYYIYRIGLTFDISSLSDNICDAYIEFTAFEPTSVYYITGGPVAWSDNESDFGAMYGRPEYGTENITGGGVWQIDLNAAGIDYLEAGGNGSGSALLSLLCKNDFMDIDPNGGSNNHLYLLTQSCDPPVEDIYLCATDCGEATHIDITRVWVDAEGETPGMPIDDYGWDLLKLLPLIVLGVTVFIAWKIATGKRKEGPQ